MSISTWLVFTISLLPLFKFSDFLFLNEISPENRSQLFSPRSKTYTVLTVFVLFPCLLVSTILGTFWFAEAQQVANCFDEQVNWFFCMWFVVLYSWIVAYTAYISFSLLDYLQRAEREREYVLLVEQYEGQNPPSLDNESSGMTPLNISRFTIQDFSSSEEHLCSVCINPFSQGEKIRVLTCFHKFHLPCIDQWLLKKASCPNCLKKFN